MALASAVLLCARQWDQERQWYAWWLVAAPRGSSVGGGEGRGGGGGFRSVIVFVFLGVPQIQFNFRVPDVPVVC